MMRSSSVTGTRDQTDIEMALNKINMNFLAQALAKDAFPPGGDLLEIGESVVASHDSPLDLLAVVAPFVPPQRSEEAARRIEAAAQSKSAYQNNIGPARALYHAIFEPAFYAAIDLGLLPRRLCVDLNGFVHVGRLFDYVINNGTSEHVFDQANVYRTIHDHTRPGGVMIHWTPCLGWTNHGFYNVQPGFFFDLANANGYQIKLIGLAALDIFFPLQSGDDYREGVAQHRRLANFEICTVLRKVVDQPFRIPIQGTYQGGRPEAYVLAKVPRHYVHVGRPNLALNKPALQSSTSRWSWHDDPAQDAAGGNNGMITGYYSFMTEVEYDPWWMVDLGSEVPINEVMVYNRIDTPETAKRAAHLIISLSDDGVSWLTVFSRAEDTAFGGADGRPLQVVLEGRRARFVRVSLPGRTILYLDEIEVY
jgi:hypothetical protein